MTDYTPTTEVVRHAVAFPRERLGEPRPIKPEAFDRWLKHVKAEAWHEGYDEGLLARPLPTRDEIEQAVHDSADFLDWETCLEIADAVLDLLKGQDK